MRVLIDKDTTNYNLRNAREQWLDKLRYKKIKLAKCEEKRKREQDNIMFQRDQKRLFRMMEGEEACRKWKSLSSFGEVPGRERERKRDRERERERGKNPIYAMDGRDKTTE